MYGAVTPKDGAYIVQEHLYKGRVAEHLLVPPRC
jgi:(2Fe-2S) ferredoxin